MPVAQRPNNAAKFNSNTIRGVGVNWLSSGLGLSLGPGLALVVALVLALTQGFGCGPSYGPRFGLDHGSSFGYGLNTTPSRCSGFGSHPSRGLCPEPNFFIGTGSSRGSCPSFGSGPIMPPPKKTFARVNKATFAVHTHGLADVAPSGNMVAGYGPCRWGFMLGRRGDVAVTPPPEDVQVLDPQDWEITSKRGC